VIVPPNLSATRGQSLARYGKKAKLGHVTPHALRHSAAKLRRETGSRIEDVGALLGHQSIATTTTYSLVATTRTTSMAGGISMNATELTEESRKTASTHTHDGWGWDSPISCRDSVRYIVSEPALAIDGNSDNNLG